MKKVIFTLLFTASLFSTRAFAFTAMPTNISVSADSTKLDDFVGKFKFEGLPFEFVEVTLKEEGKIHLVAGDRIGDVPPMPDKPNSFQTPEAVLTFIRDDKNVVIKLTIDTGGETYEGAKVTK